jgi:hypothetical protein
MNRIGRALLPIHAATGSDGPLAGRLFTDLGVLLYPGLQQDSKISIETPRRGVSGAR